MQLRIVSTLPSVSVDRYSTVCEPGVTTTMPERLCLEVNQTEVPGTQAPPSMRYSVAATPLNASVAVRTSWKLTWAATTWLSVVTGPVESIRSA